MMKRVGMRRGILRQTEPGVVTRLGPNHTPDFWESRVMATDDSNTSEVEYREISCWPYWWPRIRAGNDGSLWKWQKKTRRYEEGWMRLPSYTPRSIHEYATVQFTIEGKNKKFFAHELVLTAWDRARPYGFVCRHLNGVAWDNRPENLKWGTNEQNFNDIGKHRDQNLVRHARAIEKINKHKTRPEWGK